MKKQLLLGIVIILIFLVACTEEDTAEEDVEERVVSVETSEVQEGDYIIERSVFGRAVPSLVTPVVLPAAGEVTELDVENGDEVKAGDRIALLQTAQGSMDVQAETDGEIANLSAVEGEVVTDDSPFAVISDMDEMSIEFSLSAKERERFSLREIYQLKWNDEESEATLTMLDTMPGEDGLYAAEAKVDNTDGLILTGLILELLVPEIVEENTLIVPTEAVRTENSEDFVYVIVDNHAERRDVTVLHKGSAETAIEGEIVAGDSVVTVGQLTLADGDTVVIQEGE